MFVCESLTTGKGIAKMNSCDPNFWTNCGPDADAGGGVCSPDVNMCAPDYGEDGCLPNCGPTE